MNIREEIRGRIPRNHFVRGTLSRYRVRTINKMLINSEEREACEIDAKRKHELISSCLKKPTKDLLITRDKAFAAVNKLDSSVDKEKLLEDMVFCRLAYGFSVDEYIAFSLQDKKQSVRASYVSDLVRIRYHCRMNDLADASLFNDKYKAYVFFKEYYGREAILIGKSSDYDKFQGFIKKHPTIVKKPLFDSLGRSVELISINDCGQTEEKIFNDLISKGKHIIEEKIEQSSELARFNTSSVNTVRVVTFQTREGVEVPYCILRMGRKGSFVDNGGAGGIIACVDYASGKVITDGYDEVGGVYKNHPDSNETVKNTQLPDWNQLCILCENAAKKTDTVKFIGWDLAHTSYGWIIVEGNAGCQLIGQQTITGGILEKIQSIEERMDLIY